MAKVKDYYKILGVGRDASQDDIKKAFRKLARKYHPDLNTGDKSGEERFKEVNDAYAVLGDAQKRALYDRGGTEEFEGHRGFDAGQSFDFGDIFGDVFGGGFRSEPRPSKGEGILMGIELTLEESFFGVTKPLTFRRTINCEACDGSGAESSQTCQSCKGTGRTQSARGFINIGQGCHECGGKGRKTTSVCRKCSGRGSMLATETMNVRIPAGVDTGSVVRLRGKGNAGTAGGPAGDLQLDITIKPHALFKRKDNDLHVQLPVTFGEAALGSKVNVPTMEGVSVMKVPAGTQSGQKFKLSGKGFPSPKSGSKGDEYVEIKIVVPKDISEKGREAIEVIESLYRENPRKGMVEE